MVRFLDPRTAGGEPRNQPEGGPRDSAALCSGRIDTPSRSREAVRCRKSGPASLRFHLSWRRFLFFALRRRRQFLQLSQGRVDGDSNGLARRGPRSDSAARGRIADAAPAPQESGSKAPATNTFCGLRRKPAKGVLRAPRPGLELFRAFSSWSSVASAVAP